jgi:hypothetical protein
MIGVSAVSIVFGGGDHDLRFGGDKRGRQIGLAGIRITEGDDRSVIQALAGAFAFALAGMRAEEFERIFVHHGEDDQKEPIIGFAKIVMAFAFGDKEGIVLAQAFEDFEGEQERAGEAGEIVHHQGIGFSGLQPVERISEQGTVALGAALFLAILVDDGPAQFVRQFTHLVNLSVGTLTPCLPLFFG